MVVIVVKERAGVEDVSQASREKRQMGSEDVVDSAAEDSEDGEGGVECDEGVVGSRRVDLTTATHAGESVEHSRTAKADQSDKDYLDQRRVVSEN